MPKTGKITPQQIQKAKKIIALLPKKDNGITREEAGELLEKDFRLAFKKGYTPQEICFIFREFGITIPVKIVSKYQMAGDAAEIDGDRLKEICGKFAMKKRAVPDEDGSISGENELSGRKEIADASVAADAPKLEETVFHPSADVSASDENGITSTGNTGHQAEKSSPTHGQNAAGGMAKSEVVKQKHWDDDLDISMDDWCGPAKSGRAYAQDG